MRKLVLMVACLLFPSTFALAHSKPIHYEIIDLCDLPGTVLAEALNLNDVGEVVGVFYNPTETAFVWSRQTGMVDLGIPEFPPLVGPHSSRAHGINNCGDIVGSSYGRAIVWDRNGEARPLETHPGGIAGTANEINDAGQAVGYESCGSGAAYLWDTTRARSLFPLLAIEQYPSSIATAINHMGESTGYSYVFDIPDQDPRFQTTVWDRKRSPRDCEFRTFPNAHFGIDRTPISESSERLFRRSPNGHFGVPNGHSGVNRTLSG